MKGQALVTKTKVGVARLLNGITVQETPGAEAVVGRDTNERLADLNAVLDDERQVVPMVATTTLFAY